MAVVTGGLYAAGFYLMLRRSLVKFIIGLALLSHGANLLIFTSGGLVRGSPPVIPEGATELPSACADPIPQALILTAIVIGFAVLAFGLVLFLRVYQAIGSDDIEELRNTDT